ncbi:MAG: alpha-galactosidase [Bacteroidota bacterium]
MKRIILLLIFLVSNGCFLFGQGKNTSVAIENGLLQVSFNNDSHTWSLSEYEGDSWVPIIVNVRSSITFFDRESLTTGISGGDIDVRKESISDPIGKGQKLTVTINNDTASWTLEFVLYDGQKVASIAASVKNSSVDRWKPREFRLLDMDSSGYLQFATNNVVSQLNGYQSWSNCEIVQVDSLKSNTSYWSSIFFEPEVSRGLAIGFVENRKALNTITSGLLDTLTSQIRIHTASDLHTLIIPPRGEWRSDKLMISFGPSPFTLLERYAQACQVFADSVCKPMTPTGRDVVQRKEPAPTGWCSWYYYYQNISEDSILVNLNTAAKELKKSGLSYIQIDDGYQVAAGDWDMNKKFPHGHAWLVQQIHDKGFRAGLWLAPFAVAESSAIYRDHRNWLLKGDGDTLKQFSTNSWWGGRIYSLDPTIPEAQDWLERLFDKIVNEWGYDYVKIDFLYFAGEGAKYRRNVSPVEAYRMGLQAIRRGVGEDKFILGCGAPIGASIGYVDGMRIGGDVYAGWDGVLPCVNAAAQREFYHNAVWFNDPDCLVVRDPLSMDQARFWASVIALSGQMNLLSDKLPALPPERMGLLKMTLPSYGAVAEPLDLFEPPVDNGLTLSSPDGSLNLKLPGVWKFSTVDSMAWKEAGINDNAWKEMPVPAHWEDFGYPDLDGYAWYRITFKFPEGWRRGPLNFHFAKVDDCDETYFNGTLIGKTGEFPPNYDSQWPAFREYKVPENLINLNGDNTIAVRVYDGGGPGGIYSTKRLSTPSVWKLEVAKKYENWIVAGLYNATDHEKIISISPKELGLSSQKKYLVYDLWSDKFIGEIAGETPFGLSPASSMILSIHEKTTRPVILSTSRHITQGALDIADEGWDDRSHTLKVVSEKLNDEPYRVTLYLPAGFDVKDVVCSTPHTLNKISDSIVQITFDPITKSSMNWSVVFK